MGANKDPIATDCKVYMQQAGHMHLSSCCLQTLLNDSQRIWKE